MKLPKRVGARRELQPMAKAIQAAMKQKGMDVPALTEALGMQKTQRGAVTNWVVGRNGVGAHLRPRVAQVLGLEEAQLTMAVDSSGRRAQGTITPLGPAQRAVQLVETAIHNGELVPVVPVTDVFTFRARSDGNVVVKLDVNLPFARAAQLVQFLMTFGLAPGAEGAE